MNVVITGTSRGIGLELVKIALTKGHQVLAIARNPSDSEELMELKKNHKNLSLLALDLNVKDSEKQILDSLNDWNCVDVLVNNAGVYLDDDKVEDFEKSFLTNSIKPFFITKALKEKLKKSSRPVSVQITSQMGSIEDNKSGGSYSYRASKAALNMIFKSYSIDESWLISLLVHPGWVKTRMGGSGAPIAPHDSANGIWSLIDDANQSHSGTFRDFRGKILPW